MLNNCEEGKQDRRWYPHQHFSGALLLLQLLIYKRVAISKPSEEFNSQGTNRDVQQHPVGNII